MSESTAADAVSRPLSLAMPALRCAMALALVAAGVPLALSAQPPGIEGVAFVDSNGNGRRERLILKV